MSTASDFTISALSPDDVAYYEKQRLQGFAMCSGSSPQNQCIEAVLYEGAYSYQSSTRTGRRTMARRHYCQKHAEIFARQHGLELPPPEKAPDPAEAPRV
jgi:hypothetical protein